MEIVKKKKYIGTALAEAFSNNGGGSGGGGGSSSSTGGRYLLEPVWSPRILEEESYLRSDTFNWHDGVKYKQAYNHLLNDIKDKTASTETVAGITINCILADDGDKIILSTDTETLANLETLYNNKGIAWYFVLDTENQRFKLPRTKWNFVGARSDGTVGEYVEESLPNITGSVRNTSVHMESYNWAMEGTGAFYNNNTATQSKNTGKGSPVNCGVGFDASRSSSVYQDGAPVQQRATQMILYFYAGESESEVNSRIVEASLTDTGYSIIDPIVDANTAMFKQPTVSSDFTDGGILKLEATGNVVTITMDLELISDFTAGTRNEIFRIKNAKYLPKTSGRFIANGYSSLPCYIDCVLNEDNTEAVFYLVLKSAYTHSDTQRVQSNIMYISRN